MYLSPTFKKCFEPVTFPSQPPNDVKLSFKLSSPTSFSSGPTLLGPVNHLACQGDLVAF